MRIIYQTILCFILVMGLMIAGSDLTYIPSEYTFFKQALLNLSGCILMIIAIYLLKKTQTKEKTKYESVNHRRKN